MNVGIARAVARRWVTEEVVTTTGVIGAFLHGSTTWLPDAAPLAATSDVDILVVFDGSGPRAKPGKIRYGGVLLDVTFVPRDRVRSPEHVLGQYNLAGSFRAPNVIFDPSGHLSELQAAVATEFAKRRWVRQRCAHAAATVRRHLASADAAAPLHDQVIAWLVGAGVTTHLLLVAGLKNPTVRTRYEAVRALLAEYDRLPVHESLLQMLGCARMDRARVAEHLAAMTAAFDAAAAVIETPFPFASDISAAARPIAIDGSRELIERGTHREAVFWIAVSYARCMKVLHHDAPLATREGFDPGFRRLLVDLGIASPSDLRRRKEEVRASLPWVGEVANAIMAGNRGIVD